MKIRDTNIYPYSLKPGMVSAITWARRFYMEHTDLNFEADLQDYLVNGFVTARPNVFGMGKVIKHNGEPAWYIRMAVGNILELLSILPFPLDTVVFCRNNEKGVLRVYSFERLIRIAKRKEK